MPIPALTVRAEQIKALENALVSRWIAAYLRKCYPRQVREMGERALCGLVETAVKAARARGLTAAPDQRKFGHVTFLLGPGFDKNPRYAWARRILDNPDFKHSTARLRALEDEVLRQFQKAEVELAG